MSAYYTVVIVTALVGFLLLAALLLVPVYRFLKREERASERWTREALRRQAEERAETDDGAAAPRDTSTEYRTPHRSDEA